MGSGDPYSLGIGLGDVYEVYDYEGKADVSGESLYDLLLLFESTSKEDDLYQGPPTRRVNA